MTDIAPKILDLIGIDFRSGVDESKKIKILQEILESGNATYATAHDYATEVGRILAKSFSTNISSAMLPDGKMHYNISKRVVESTLADNQNMVANFSARVQASLNEKAGLGIKSLKAPINKSKVAGFVERLSVEEVFDNVAWILGEPVVNFCQSVVEDVLRANAAFHYELGLEPTITRTMVGDCCDWCKELAGTYPYKDVKETGHPVFMRHQRCDCLVEYDPGDGRRQNAHTKKWA